ncbi:hypothetical protein CB1_000568063 [Camelus ferus]|nr:hypothetical protein CB1_000568063 [Camelus ferus]
MAVAPGELHQERAVHFDSRHHTSDTRHSGVALGSPLLEPWSFSEFQGPACCFSRTVSYPGHPQSPECGSAHRDTELDVTVQNLSILTGTRFPPAGPSRPELESSCVDRTCSAPLFLGEVGSEGDGAAPCSLHPEVSTPTVDTSRCLVTLMERGGYKGRGPLPARGESGLEEGPGVVAGELEAVPRGQRWPGALPRDLAPFPGPAQGQQLSLLILSLLRDMETWPQIKAVELPGGNRSSLTIIDVSSKEYSPVTFTSAKQGVDQVFWNSQRCVGVCLVLKEAAKLAPFTFLCRDSSPGTGPVQRAEVSNSPRGFLEHRVASGAAGFARVAVPHLCTPVNPVLAQGSRTSLTVPHRCHTGIAIVTAEPDLPVCDLKLPQKHRERDPPPGLWVIRPLSSLRLPDVHPQKAAPVSEKIGERSDDRAPANPSGEAAAEHAEATGVMTEVGGLTALQASCRNGDDASGGPGQGGNCEAPRYRTAALRQQ